ncbi:hypothetical protein EDD17DRAFT_1529396 [Pisolithus thermaeus]|nr:hypothetical protein EDD17DRAFT_1529396 [Pisolithus thermaeus]
MKCIHVCQHMRQLYGPAIADPIADAVILFIGAFMKSSSWHWREAAVMTFGSTLNGPGSSILTHLVNCIDAMEDMWFARCHLQARCRLSSWWSR